MKYFVSVFIGMLITVALLTIFHAEFKRVTVPKGHVGIVWGENLPDIDSIHQAGTFYIRNDYDVNIYPTFAGICKETL